MKQLNFSNIVAIVAVLLCFYAFTNEKKTSSPQTEKEFCFMRIDPKFVRASYSDGKYEEENVDAYVSDNKDSYLIKIYCKKITEMANNGWELTEITKDYAANIYIFERSK